MGIYISDIIGDEYKGWDKDDIIFISSPTGTGKTTFIFDKLLPYLKSKNKRILYLVNRSVLKKQLIKSCSKLPLEDQNYIQIESYQAIESLLLELSKKEATPDYINGFIYANNIIAGQNTFPYNTSNDELNRKLNWFANYDCLVCDEAHYFISDSNFNKNTILSYNFIRRFYSSKQKIFISATIEDVKLYICDGAPFNWNQRTPWFSLWNESPLLSKQSEKNYSCERNYDYIQLHFFHDTNSMAKQIKNEGGKWLIFVDSKEVGYGIKKQIIDDPDSNLSVAFVTADYEVDFEALNEVQSIVANEQQSADVLIATSVLDNGINISDEKLRKIVIMADNETEFIQMLGRRRRNNEKVDVYVYLYGKAHFKSRININNNRKRYAENFYKGMLFMMRNQAAIQSSNSVSQDLFNKERISLIEHSRLIVDNIFEIFDQIKYTHLSFNGMIYLNPLSMKNLQNLNRFYNKIVCRFEDGDEYAFAREVMNWLNKNSDAELETALMDNFERALNHICKKFSEKNNTEMSKSDNIKLKEELKSDLRLILKHKKSEINKNDYDTMLGTIDKGDRPLSVPFMDALNKVFGIKYTMTTKNGKYIILIDSDN